MGFSWPIMLRPLEYCGDFGLPLPNDAPCDHRLERPIFPVNAWRQPKRDPQAVAGALRCSCCKRACSEGAKQPRDMQQVLMRIPIHPARYRIGDKSQNSVAMAWSTWA